jgi:hypothetical protein
MSLNRVSKHMIDPDFVKQVEESFHYEEIKVTKYRDQQSMTDYWITTVPYKDKHGDIIEIKKEFANDKINNIPEKPIDFASRTGASLVTNASIWENGSVVGTHIKDGVVYQSKQTTINYTLGFTKEREMIMYPPNTTVDEMLEDGVVNTWVAFFPMIIDSQPTDPNIYNVTENPSQPNPRQVIAMKPNKDLIFLTAAGREDDNKGMTYDDCIRILQGLEVEHAYCLDGGGSAQTIHNNVLIGALVDDGLKEERPVYDFIYFKKTTLKPNEPIYQSIGDISKRVKKTENLLINKYGDSIPGRLIFEDYIYLNKDKALYGIDSSQSNQRIIGMINDRIYVGDPDIPLSIHSKNNILVNIDNTSYHIGLIPNNPEWIEPTLLNGYTVALNRNVGYMKVGNMVTIRGCVSGSNFGENNPIFTLPKDFRPTQQLVFVIPVFSSQERSTNNLVIYTNGNVVIHYSTSGSIQIDTTFSVL